jgi:hypothetical protein
LYLPYYSISIVTTCVPINKVWNISMGSKSVFTGFIKNYKTDKTNLNSNFKFKDPLLRSSGKAALVRTQHRILCAGYGLGYCQDYCGGEAEDPWSWAWLCQLVVRGRRTGTRCSNLARWRHRTESGERINPIGTSAIAVSRCPRSFPAQNAKGVCCPKPTQVPKRFVAQNWLKCTSAKAGSQRPVDKNVETERFFKKPSGF